MPRRKIQMGLIGREAARTRTFTERKKGLKKKAWELSVLCDIDVAVVCAGGPGGAPDVWEFGGAGVIDRYRRLPADKRAKHTYLGYLNAELGKEKAKLAKERQGGPKALAPPGAASLKGVNLEELLGSIDAALLATAERRKALGVPDGAPDAAAVPIGQGAAPLAGGGDGGFGDMEAWVEELTWHGGVEPPNPFDASMMQQPVPGAVQYTNGVEPHQLNASMMQPASGVQYINGGNPYLMQQMGGNNGETAGHGQLAWDASHSTVSSSYYPDYGFQYTDSNCTDMAVLPQMPVPSNAADGCWFNQAMWGADESSSCDAVVPVEYYHHPSLDFAGNPVYMPPEHSGMGSGECFTGVPGIGLDDSFMDAGGYGYGTQCSAGYFQCPDPARSLVEWSSCITSVTWPTALLSVTAALGHHNLVQSSPNQMCKIMIQEFSSCG